MYNYTISVVNLKPKETINLKSNNSIMIINSTLNVLSVRLLNSNPLINPKTKEKINFTDDKIMSNAIEWGMKKLKTREFKTDNVLFIIIISISISYLFFLVTFNWFKNAYNLCQ